MRKKKTIIIISVLLAVGIAAAIVFLPRLLENLPDTVSGVSQLTAVETASETENTETPSTITNPENAETPGNFIERRGEIAVTERNDKVIVIGFGKEPWIVPRDRGEVVNYETNYANNALLLYLTQDGIETLYYKTENEEIRIENVRLWGGAISEDGNHFAYVVMNKDTSENTVMFYNNGETETIYSSENYTFAEISPNGKTVSWTVLINNNTDSETYVKIGENFEKIGMNLEEIYISDNAEFIYYKEEESGNYYVQKGFDRENRQYICRQKDNDFIKLCYNFDCTQAYYQDDLGNGEYRTYLIINGEKPRLISNYYAYVDLEANHGYIDPVKDLTKAVWTEVHREEEYNVLFGLNSDYSTFQIAENADSFIPANSGNICYFISHEKLYKVDSTNPDSEPILIADNAQSFCSSPDYKNLYIINLPYADSFNQIEGAAGLYSVNPTGGKTLISETFDYATADNENLYYFDGSILYKWKDENSLQIADFKESSELTVGCFIYTYSLIIAPDGSLVVYTPSGEIYVQMDGKNFVNIEEYAR
jgi:hypothetical protein